MKKNKMLNVLQLKVVQRKFAVHRVARFCVFIFAAAALGFALIACGSNGDPSRPNEEIDLRPQYTVIYYSGYQEGLDEKGSIVGASVGVREGDGANLPGNPRRAAYVFEGWYTQLNGEGDIFTSSTPVTENMEVYADWELARTYNITLLLNDGTNDFLTVADIPEGQTAGTLPEVTRDGWRFDYWLWPGNGEFTADIQVLQEITITAQWVKVWTVTFDMNGGLPSVATQIIDDNDYLIEPDPEPTRITATDAGLYAGTPDSGTAVQRLASWNIGNTTSEWNFDTKVTDNLSLTATWEGSVETNLVPVNSADTLRDAFDWIRKTPGSYTLLLDSNINLSANQDLADRNIDLTIMGMGGIDRTISFTGSSYNPITLSSGAKLTLGNNIIISGLSSGSNNLVTVTGNGNEETSTTHNTRFTMLEGSRLTGHATTSIYGVVNVNGGIFNMKGGTISGNDASSTDSQTAVVHLRAGQSNRGTINLDGGTINANTSLVDVYVNSDANSFSMAGGAVVRTITLNAASSGNRATIKIGSGWTGSITSINLRGTTDNINTIIEQFWFNRSTRAMYQVLVGATAAQSGQSAAHTLTAADVARVVGMGSFFTTEVATNYTNINNNYELGRTGTTSTTLGRLVRKALVVTTGNDTTASPYTAGSLRRYIMTEAWDGDTITFADDVKTVTLAGTLLIQGNTKNFTIEGNGVTITRSGNYNLVTVGADSTNANNKNSVTFRRVWFKGGSANVSGNGGGVRVWCADATFESCIFTDNRAYNYGGALYVSNDLTGAQLRVIGCTFYNNYGFGGAIGFYNTKTGSKLTVYGSLFQGNTSSNINEATLSVGFSTTNSALGYNEAFFDQWLNVVDRDNWAGGSRSQAFDTGWDNVSVATALGAGTTNTTSLFDNINTFAPVSHLRGHITTTTSFNAVLGHPDFYGTTRDLPAAPGAVR